MSSERRERQESSVHMEMPEITTVVVSNTRGGGIAPSASGGCDTTAIFNATARSGSALASRCHRELSAVSGRGLPALACVLMPTGVDSLSRRGEQHRKQAVTMKRAGPAPKASAITPSSILSPKFNKTPPFPVRFRQTVIDSLRAHCRLQDPPQPQRLHHLAYSCFVQPHPSACWLNLHQPCIELSGCCVTYEQLLDTTSTNPFPRPLQHVDERLLEKLMG